MKYPLSDTKAIPLPAFSKAVRNLSSLCLKFSSAFLRSVISLQTEITQSLPLIKTLSEDTKEVFTSPDCVSQSNSKL